MPDDLLDAKAAVNWAMAQLPVLQERGIKWCSDEPYTVVIDTYSEPGKKVYRLGKVKPLDPLMSAEAGAIIHSIRSSLDILACTLAARNGHPGSRSTHFPIWKTEAAFNCAKSPPFKFIKRLSQIDQAVIKNLQPHPGGNELLCTLHELDLTRKHRRLLNISPRPSGVGFTRAGAEESVFHDWRGFQENTPIVTTLASVPDSHPDFFLQISFNETGVLKGNDLATTIREFAGLAHSIIDIFGYP
jgi:hypothetical protein